MQSTVNPDLKRSKIVQDGEPFFFSITWKFRKLLNRQTESRTQRAIRGILALVGESGCGKTTLGRALLRLVEPTDGTVRFDGVELRALPPKELRAIRRRMQIVFQDPFASLSPRRQIGQILASLYSCTRS